VAALRVEQKLLAAAVSSGSGEFCRSPKAPPHRPHTSERTAFPLPHKHTRGTSSHAHLWHRALGGGSGAGASPEAPLSTLHTFRGSISRSFIHTYTPPLDTCRRFCEGKLAPSRSFPFAEILPIFLHQMNSACEIHHRFCPGAIRKVSPSRKVHAPLLRKSGVSRTPVRHRVWPRALRV